MAEKVVPITKALPDHLAPVFAQFPLDVRDAGGVYLHTPSGRKVLALVPSHHNHALGERIGIRLDVDHVVAFQPEAAPAATP